MADDDFNRIAAQVNEPNEKFDAFYDDMMNRIPALKGRGAIELQPAAFKRALKIAWLVSAETQLRSLLD